MRWAELDFQPVRGAREISVSYTWTGLTVWTVMMPETTNHFIPIQRHVSQRMGEGLSKDTIFSHTSPFRATFIRLIAFPLIACYDIVHQDRDAFPVLLTSSSSSESSPSGWSSSSSLLSVSLISADCNDEGVWSWRRHHPFLLCKKNRKRWEHICRQVIGWFVLYKAWIRRSIPRAWFQKS